MKQVFAIIYGPFAPDKITITEVKPGMYNARYYRNGHISYLNDSFEELLKSSLENPLVNAAQWTNLAQYILTFGRTVNLR